MNSSASSPLSFCLYMCLFSKKNEIKINQSIRINYIFIILIGEADKEDEAEEEVQEEEEEEEVPVTAPEDNKEV